MISTEKLNSVSFSALILSFLRTDMHASGLGGFKLLGDSG